MDGRLINGYAVEAAPNGAWWVRCPERPHQAWRFASRLEAVRFAQRLRAPQAATGRSGGGIARRPR
jgi:hypothetical protein